MAAAAAICGTATSRGRRNEATAGGDARLTRRELIAAALGLSVAVPAQADEPPVKVSQLAAAYRATPNGLFSCAACTFFIVPSGCKVVSGAISPSGWCKLFDLAD